MSLSHARALIPSQVPVHVEEREAQRDGVALHRLACWALRYSPIVAVDPPDGLLLDATGLETLYPGAGEAGLSRAIGEALVPRGFAVRIAVAGTYAGARALARFGRPAVTHVPPGGDREALACLPAAALGVDRQTAAAFDEIGLTKLGHLFDLPRASLASRFGDELLRRVDRALGRAPEIIDPVRPESPPRAQRLFEDATDRWESLETAARDVLDRLIAVLRSRGQGVRQLELEVLRPVRRGGWIRRVRLSRPSLARSHLWSMLRSVLERVDVAAGIVGVSLRATEVGRLVLPQTSWQAFAPPSSTPVDVEWGEIADTLAGRLGEENVLRFEPVASHLPERAFRARSATEERAVRPAATIAAADRPTRLFAPAIPARVILRAPDGPILQISWRGRRERVIACAGPERIGAEWWRFGPAAKAATGTSDRDYFTVQTEDGAWLWVGRRLDAGPWFVQGDWA